MKKFSSKDDEEIYTLGFDFVDDLAGTEMISSATMTVALQSGTTDPGMGTMLMNGLTISDTVVAQQIHNGVPGNVYRIDCFATTSAGNKYLMQGTMAVTEKNP